VELMGGRIWTESEEGKGSTFHFTIIVESPSNIMETIDRIKAVNSVMAGKRVLVIDDSDSARKMLLAAVRPLNVTVGMASSLPEARSKLSVETYDIVILDATMKDMDGQDLAEDIRSGKYGQARMLLIAPLGYRTTSKMQADGWLTKPVRTLALRNILIKLVAPQNPEEVKAETAGPNAAEINQQQERQQPSLRILMAEDNLVNQKVALSMLKKLGYKADVATNGLEVLQALKNKPYDVVLMDVQMPEMDGLEATRRIRGSGLSTRIVAMTAHALEGDKDECLQAGMNEYISKPINMEELRKILEVCSESCAAAG
jgi:CheY-like chemotaxis protein